MGILRRDRWADRARCPNNVYGSEESGGCGVGEIVATNRKVRASRWRMDLRALPRGQKWIQAKPVLFVGAEQGMGPEVMPLFQVGQMMLLWPAPGTRQEASEQLVGAFGMF